MPDRTATWDVAIIGGGHAGRATAEACLRGNQQVLLFERGETGPLASLEARGVTVVPASAHFIAPDRVEAAGRAYTFRQAVIAAGQSPRVPDLYGLAAVPWLTLEDWPAQNAPGAAPQPHLLVLGGGAEAVAAAQAHAWTGQRVSLIQTEPNILPDHEIELVAALRDPLRAAGVELHENAVVLAAEPGPDGGVALRLEGGAMIAGSVLLVATGGAPRLAPLDLPAGRVDVTDSGLVLRQDLRSSSNGRVWAAGSVTGQPASPGHHAAIVAEAMLRGRVPGTAPQPAPRLVPTHPALAQVGLTEAEARAAGREPLVARVTLPGGGQGKLVADGQGLLLGAGILAEGAGETAALLASAVARGLTGAALAAEPLPRGTMAEALAQAAAGLGGADFPSSPMRRILGALDRWR